MRITFEIDGVTQFARAFNRIGSHVSDLRPVWEKVERAFYVIESEQFKSEGAKGRGGKWKQLNRKYAEAKRKKYGGAKILYRTGALQRSLTGKTGDSVLIKEKTEFGIGTNLFYAAFHQSGTQKMPQREVISFSDSQRVDLQKEIQKGLLEILRGDRSITQSLEVE